MTRKEKILSMIEKLPKNVSYDKILYHLFVMRSIEIGEKQIERGEFIDHDELFDRLEAEYAQNQAGLDSRGGATAGAGEKLHRARTTQGGSKVRQPAKKRRQKA